MNSPLVSIIIRTSAPRKGCLLEAIESVLSQTYQNIELVIVENGSHSLEKWLQQIDLDDDSRIKYCHSEKQNRCIAGNLGCEQAAGEYLCFLDDDDLFYPDHIAVLVGALEKNQEIGGAYSVADELPTEILNYTPFEYRAGVKRVSFQREFSRGALFVNNYLAIQCVLFRKSLFIKYGGFDPELERLEDWNLWTRYASEKDFIYINKITSMYRTPYTMDQILLRDKELDEYYPQAREKQKDIAISLDIKLLTEILNEIFRPSKIFSLMYSNFSKKRVKQSSNYKQFCKQHNVDLETEVYSTNILEAISLANKIVTENKVLWFTQRMEHTIKRIFRLSTLKRICLRN